MPRFGLSTGLPFNIDNLLDNSSKKGDSSRCCRCYNSNDQRMTEKCNCRCHNSYTSFHAGQKERKRTTFTQHQEEVLKSAFIRSAYINGNQRKHLANQLGLDETQVKRKFQNMRANLKKKPTDSFSMGKSLQPSKPGSHLFNNLAQYGGYNTAKPKYLSYGAAGAGSLYSDNLKQFGRGHEHIFSSYGLGNKVSSYSLPAPTNSSKHNNMRSLMDMLPHNMNMIR